MIDSRRVCDGVRLHPLLGEILQSGAQLLRESHPEAGITTTTFARSAIALFSELGLIYMVEANKSTPANLSPALIRIAKRQSGSPYPHKSLRANGSVSGTTCCRR
jgi:hypothetical protein